MGESYAAEAESKTASTKQDVIGRITLFISVVTFLGLVVAWFSGVQVAIGDVGELKKDVSKISLALNGDAGPPIQKGLATRVEDLSGVPGQIAALAASQKEDLAKISRPEFEAKISELQMQIANLTSQKAGDQRKLDNLRQYLRSRDIPGADKEEIERILSAP